MTSLLPTYNPASPDYKVYTDCLTQSFNPLFASLLTAPSEGLVFMTGSSTIQDLQGDTMQDTALKDMTEVHPHLSIWMNHDYELPGKLYGSLACSPLMSAQSGIADLHLAVETELENPDAAQTFRYIQKGRRLGCSGGFRVLDYTINDEGIDEDDFFGMMFAPLTINHVEAVEWSIVGVPANQRSWVENAAQGIFLRSLAEGKDEEARKLAPIIKSLFPRDFQSTLKALSSESMRKDMEKIPEPPQRAPRLFYEPLRKVFLLQHLQKEQIEVSHEEVAEMLKSRGAKQISGSVEETQEKGVKPPNPPEGTHEPFSGTHTHPHVAYGMKADGDMHTHTHTHHDEADHHHDHSQLAAQGDKSLDPSVEEDEKAITPPNTVHDDGSFHDPMTGTHTHPHATYGKAMAGSGTHSHNHTHFNDNDHTHDHPQTPGEPDADNRGGPSDHDGDEPKDYHPPITGGPMYRSFFAMGEAMGYDMSLLSGESTKALTKADMVHCQSIHDHVHALSGGAVCGEGSQGNASGQSTDSAATQAQQQRDSQASWQKSLDALTTLVKGFEGVDLAAIRHEAITAGAAARTALEQAASFQKQMTELEQTLFATSQATNALRNMPLSRPTMQQERQIESGTASYEEMKDAGRGELTLKDALRRTHIRETAQTRNGIGLSLSYREWPEGLAPTGGRPPLSADEQSLMSPMDILRYGENRKASVPLLDPLPFSQMSDS